MTCHFQSILVAVTIPQLLSLTPLRRHRPLLLKLAQRVCMSSHFEFPRVLIVKAQICMVHVPPLACTFLSLQEALG